MSIQIKSNKVRWVISAVFATLILFGTYHNIFSMIAFLLMCLFMFYFERESVLQQLFFVLPMSSIFKMSPSSQSFFTIILLLYVALCFVLPRKATVLIVLFSVYVIIGQFLSEGFMLFRTIKIICNILFLSSILNHKVQLNHKEMFFSYIFGNLIASCMGMIDSNFFKIKNYVGVADVGGFEFIDLTRFKGLYVDPNYYTVGIIISLCLIIVMYHRKEIKTVFAVSLSMPFLYFLILTYSKSAILALFFPLVFLLYSLLKQKKIIVFFTMIFSVVALLIAAFDGKVELLNVVIARFSAIETTGGTDINSLTTGRFELWVLYAKALLENPFITIFGRGINASILDTHAAHNTYLDLLYYLGIWGTVLFVSILYLILRQSKRIIFKRNLLNYSVLLCMLFLYFGLSELFYFDMPFHFFFAFMILNLPMTTDGNAESFQVTNSARNKTNSLIGDLK